MKPLAYGFMRVPSGAEDEDIRQIELALKNFAEVKGFCFAAVFHEHVVGSQAVFGDLVKELQRAQAHHVIVPSVQHLASHPILRMSMLVHLELEAGASVHELYEQ